MTLMKEAVLGRFGRVVGKAGRRRPKESKPITVYQPRIDREIQQPALPVRLDPDSRRFGYGPLDEKPKHIRTSGIITHPNQLGPVGRALASVGCCEMSYEPVPGKRLERTLAMLRPGGTLVVFDAIHASGCSVSKLRALKREIEGR